MNKKGLSKCPVGQERHEYCWFRSGRYSYSRVQYEYRARNGKLFSCVAKTLAEARERRDRWIAKNLEV
jgi:hypothetical protein